MKRMLSIFLFFTFTLNAQVPDEVHEKCKDVADYVGCVQIFTGQVKAKKETGIPEVKELRKALGLLPSRLQNTSLNNLSTSIQPFTDALAKAELSFNGLSDADYSLEERNEIGELYLHGMKIDSAIDIYRETRYSEIEYESESSVDAFTSRSCSRYDNYVFSFNSIFETNYLGYEKISDRAFDSSGFFCRIEWRNERYGYELIGRMSTGMMRKIISYIDDVLQGVEPIKEEVKTLQQVKDEFVEPIVAKTNEDIARYNAINMTIDDPFVISENISEYSKRDFSLPHRTWRNKIAKMSKRYKRLETVGVIVNNVEMEIPIGGLNESDKEAIKNALLFHYALDYGLAKKKGWWKNHTAEGMTYGKVTRIIQQSDFAVRANLGSSSNPDDARKYLIGALSIPMDECEVCFDSDGRPNRSYELLIEFRNGIKKYSEAVNQEQ